MTRYIGRDGRPRTTDHTADETAALAGRLTRATALSLVTVTDEQARAAVCTVLLGLMADASERGFQLDFTPLLRALDATGQSATAGQLVQLGAVARRAPRVDAPNPPTRTRTVAATPDVDARGSDAEHDLPELWWSPVEGLFVRKGDHYYKIMNHDLWTTRHRVAAPPDDAVPLDHAGYVTRDHEELYNRAVAAENALERLRTTLTGQLEDVDDPAAAWYVRVTDDVVHHTTEVPAETVHVDWTRDGTLVGVELLGDMRR